MKPLPVATLAWLLGLVTMLFAPEDASAANSRLCVKNIGDAAVKAAVMYRGAWGGWVAEGWWLLEPPDGSWFGRCVNIPENDHDGAIFHYLAFRQQAKDGKWYEAAFDVKEIQWIEDGTDTVGANFTIVPRSTAESGQTRSITGERDTAGVKIITCIPNRGVKKLSTLAEQTSCGPSDLLVLFGTKFYTPTDGGIFATNDFNVYVRTDRNARLFELTAPKPNPDAGDRTTQKAAPQPRKDGAQSYFSNRDPDKPSEASRNVSLVLGHLFWLHPISRPIGMLILK